MRYRPDGAWRLNDFSFSAEIADEPTRTATRGRLVDAKDR
jgi:hypothetical protein